MIVDDIGRRMREAGASSAERSIDRAAAVPGLFLAWSAQMGLVHHRLTEGDSRALLRLKYREITGGELLVSACGGCLDHNALSPAGMAFAAKHYAAFEAVVQERLGSPIKDDWPSYDRVAPWLTERYLGPPPGRRMPAWRQWLNKWRK